MPYKQVVKLGQKKVASVMDFVLPVACGVVVGVIGDEFEGSPSNALMVANQRQSE
jgi:hypothetical protein